MGQRAITFSGDLLDMDGSSFTLHDMYDEDLCNDLSFTNPAACSVTGTHMKIESKFSGTLNEGDTLCTPPFSPRLPEESVDFAECFALPGNYSELSKIASDTSSSRHFSSEREMEQDEVQLDVDFFLYEVATGWRDSPLKNSDVRLMAPHIQVPIPPEDSSETVKASIDDVLDLESIVKVEEPRFESNKVDELVAPAPFDVEDTRSDEISAHIQEHIAGFDWDNLCVTNDVGPEVPIPVTEGGARTILFEEEIGSTMTLVKVGDIEHHVIQESVMDGTGQVQQIAVILIGDELVKVPIVEDIERLFSPTVVIDRLFEHNITPEIGSKNGKRSRTAKSTENSVGRPVKRARQIINACTPISWKEKEPVDVIGQKKRGRGRPRKTVVENIHTSKSAGNTPCATIPTEEIQTPTTEPLDQAHSADARNLKCKYGLRNRNRIKHSV